MIVRLLVLCGVLAGVTVYAADRSSELKLSRPVEGSGQSWYIISAAAHKRVLVSVKSAAVAALDVSAEFPFSVSLMESPTPRYKFVILFEDRQKAAVIDSFGVTPEGSVEQTDEETHKMLIESAAKGRALGEKLGKEIRGEQQ